MLTNKMLKLIDSTVLREEYDRDASRTADKIKRVAEKQSICEHKLDENREKLFECLEQLDEETEKAE